LQTLDEFRVAAKFFWFTFSAYCRAVSSRVIDSLLKTLSEECGASWHDSEEFRLVWRQAYDNMMKFYVNKVMYYGDKFMESPAGIALKTTLDKSRKRHGALPAVNEETLLKYQGADGLSWTLCEVADFFQILSEYTTTTTFQGSV